MSDMINRSIIEKRTNTNSDSFSAQLYFPQGPHNENQDGKEEEISYRVDSQMGLVINENGAIIQDTESDQQQ